MKSFFFACSVCFGDPHSFFSKGAIAGALFLLGTIGVVLAVIAGVAARWAARARKLQARKP